MKLNISAQASARQRNTRSHHPAESVRLHLGPGQPAHPHRSLGRHGAVPDALVGAARRLIRFDDPFTTFGRGAFAARGSTIYVTLLRSESDVWTADLVRR